MLNTAIFRTPRHIILNMYAFWQCRNCILVNTILVEVATLIIFRHYMSLCKSLISYLFTKTLVIKQLLVSFHITILTQRQTHIRHDSLTQECTSSLRIRIIIHKLLE